MSESELGGVLVSDFLMSRLVAEWVRCQSPVPIPDGVCPWERVWPFRVGGPIDSVRC